MQEEDRGLGRKDTGGESDTQRTGQGQGQGDSARNIMQVTVETGRNAVLIDDQG
jgi:hypothetical protein